MPRSPKHIGDVLSELMARRGFARVQSAEQFEAGWREAAGTTIAQYTRPGTLRRGTLEVTVANSTLMQELVFQKPTLLKALAKLLPEERIEDLRFRVGAID